MSRYYGEKNAVKLKSVQKMAYAFAILLAALRCVVMFLIRTNIGALFGSSNEVNLEIAKIMPIFLVSVPFVAITRIATASFYTTEKSVLSYVLTLLESVLMLVLMLVLPRFGGQIMIWWSTVLARIFASVLALVLTGMQRHNV